MDKSKPIWIICSDKELCDDLIKRLAYVYSHQSEGCGGGRSHCPPRKERCGKIYDNGCTECWEEWFAQNVEAVHDE